MAGKSWNDLLGDVKTYPDSTQVTLADGTTVSLGELRSLTKTQQDQLKTREDKLAADLAALKKSQEELQLAQQHVAQLFAEMGTRGGGTPPPEGGGQGGPDIDYEKDAYLGPLAKQVKALEAAVQKMDEASKALQKDLMGSRALYENDRLYSQWELLPAAERRPFDEMLKYAADQGHKDRFGRLDLRRTHDVLTADARAAKARQDAIEEGRKLGVEEGRRQAEASFIPRPGGSGQPPAGKPKYKTFGEAMTAASQDPDIVRGLIGQPPGPEQQGQ